MLFARLFSLFVAALTTSLLSPSLLWANTLTASASANFADIERRLEITHDELMQERKGMDYQLYQNRQLDFCVTLVIDDTNQLTQVLSVLHELSVLSSQMINKQDERSVNSHLEDRLLRFIPLLKDLRSTENQTAGLCSYNALVVNRSHDVISYMDEIITEMNAVLRTIRQ